ncbi:MAG: hypothetical protein COU28_01140 [Candidatus Magasanikbacteria bacterium CG10_big_fil_rev_8_21_14_0_10_36_16]|uniref:Thioredoxin domain-containing protein n=1 Tax=Candidatus Magasanikbacteria bacterium CG10_big_fil_rev_8_21_14_0_10_36_16 TaxID=1974645 RepID=A0A2H0TZ79_9BACT|nr:MAG: hypothetical protein COU28_01140 [Candidatus Magasanikbacteria bacterium CG10_big_fil_rev_8_21_14_0_10_36_16]
MPKQSKFWKYFFIFLASIVGLIFTFFLIFFIYYLAQLRYGNSETKKKITSEYERNFSTDINKDAPQDTTDYKKFVRKYNPTQGNTNAKVTIITFLDFQCPYCQTSYPTFSHVIEKYKPVIQVVFKNLPLTDIHPDAIAAALASTCASEQNKFWEYYTQVFTNKKLDTDSLYNYGQSLGLDMNKFDTCFKTQRNLTDIQQDLKDAVDLGLRGTPTYLVNGKIIEGVISAEEWDNIIIKNLNQ